MNEPLPQQSSIRSGLVETLHASRDAEREIFGSIDSAVRDAPASDGGWSPKDVQAHLSAWRRRTVERLRAIREGTDEPTEVETDETNAIFHAERAGWSWDEVVA